MKSRGGPPLLLMNSRGGPPFLGCMLMNFRGGPPILRGGLRQTVYDFEVLLQQRMDLNTI